MSRRLRSYAIFWCVAMMVLAADQVSKHLVEEAHRATGERTLQHCAGWLRMVYVENTGAAWGIFSGKSLPLGLLGVVALGAIYALRRALQIKRVWMQVAFGMLCAGIAGNMIDRFLLGFVVDFIDMELWGLRFLVFNVADVGITGGVALYVAYSVWEAVGKRRGVARAVQAE